MKWCDRKAGQDARKLWSVPHVLNYFWNKDFPTRSFTRIFILVSACIYLLGRLVDPGPHWLRQIIGIIIDCFNLEFIQAISLLAPVSIDFWRGSGLALQMQLILTWPLVSIFALWAGWLSRNGSKDFEKYPPMIKEPSIKNGIKNILPVAIVAFIAYYPFHGSDITRLYKPSGPYIVIGWDTYTTSLFWIFGGWLIIYLSTIGFYVINTEFKLYFDKGN